jgi:hypothetical protein
VTCRARLDGVNSNQDHPAGVRLSEFLLIISPSEINAAQWPGESVPVPASFDPRIPRANDTEDVMLRGQARVITLCDPKVINGELVRIDLRCVA